MIVTEQQQLWLQAHLRKALKYRETYDELYDHILTAVTNKPSTRPFENMVEGIINDDFGGYNALPNLELSSKRAAEKEGLKLFFTYFIDCFKFPNLLYTAAAAAFIYYFSSHLALSPKYLYLLLAFILVVIPFIFTLSGTYEIFAVLKTRFNKTGIVFNHTLVKPSVKADIYNRVIILPVIVFVITNVLLPLFGFEKLGIRYNNSPLFVTSVLMMAILYAVSLIKLCKNDFDVNFLQLAKLINHEPA